MYPTDRQYFDALEPNHLEMGLELEGLDFDDYDDDDSDFFDEDEDTPYDDDLEY